LPSAVFSAQTARHRLVMPNLDTKGLRLYSGIQIKNVLRRVHSCHEP